MSKSVLEVSHKPKKPPAKWFSRLPKPPWRYPSAQYRCCLLNAMARCSPCSFLPACRPHREGNSAPWCPWSASQPYTFHSKVTTQLGNRGGLKALKPNSGFFLDLPKEAAVLTGLEQPILPCVSIVVGSMLKSLLGATVLEPRQVRTCAREGARLAFALLRDPARNSCDLPISPEST